MPKATKRERQRINRELRREAMRKAEQRRKRWRTTRNVVIALVVVGLVFGFIKLLQGGDEEASGVTCANVPQSKASDQTFSSPPPMTIDTSKQYTAVMDTTCGTITMALDAATYPVSVNNFVFLADQKFYNGLDFVRAAKNFVIQAGSPDNQQSGGPGYSVQGEVPTTQPPYPVGALAMAKSGAEPAGTAGSQFFIVTGSKNSGLTADYAGVGRVVKGMDVAKKIGTFYPTEGDGALTTTVRINKVTIKVGKNAASSSTSAPTTSTAASG